MPSYEWFTGDLLTGRIYSRLPVVSSSWQNVMDDADVMQIVVQLGDPAIDKMEPVSNTSPCKNFLAVAYLDDDGNETFLAGGPIWTQDYDDTTGQLTVAAGGLWGYFDHRKVMPVLAGANPATVTSTWASLSLGTIAKRLVQQAQTHTGGNLPIVFQADEAGTFTSTYPGYELDWIGQVLRDITAATGGVEVQFQPQRQTDPRFLRWVMVTGTNEDPLIHQQGSDWILDASVPRSSISSIGVHVDGSGMGDEAWVKGNGSDISTVIGHQVGTALTGLGYALFETELTGHDDVQDPTVLAGYAATDLLFSQRPGLTLSPQIDRDGSPMVSQYNVGDYVRIVIPVGHKYFTVGATYRSRVTSKSGDDSQVVSLQLMTVLE